MDVRSLAEAPEKRDEVLELIGRCFPKGATVSRPLPADEEFALLLAPRNRERVLFGCAPDGRAVCAAAWAPFEFRLPGAVAPAKVAGLGLIVTDEGFRQQGYSRLLQQQIEARAIVEGCLIAVLWSDLLSFYQRLGYTIGGREFEWQAEGEALARLGHRLNDEKVRAGWELRPLEAAHLPAVLELYARQGLGPRREASSFAPALLWPNSWSWGAFRHGAAHPAAYAIMGKARDLRDTVHEICGDAGAVGALLGAASSRVEKALHLQAHPATPLKDEISHWLGEPVLRPLGFFKVIDPQAFATWIQIADYLPLGASLRAASDGSWSLLKQGRPAFTSADPAHLSQIFLGPYKPGEIEGLPFEATNLLKGLEPLDVYFWGLDSV
jgi:GNAT superfamily N-acetyltransferase